VKVIFDGFQMANLLVLLSFGGQDLVYMPTIVHGLAQGDGTLAATLLQQVVTGTPSGFNGFPLLWGVFCREQMAFTSAFMMLKTAERALPGFPSSTLRLTPQIVEPYDDCKVWNVGKANPKIHEVPKSNVPRATCRCCSSVERSISSPPPGRPESQPRASPMPILSTSPAPATTL
jgi:hypothetical protein